VGALLIAAEVKKFIAVAYNAFPLLLEKGFELRQILQDNGHRYPSGTHNGQNLIEVIGQRYIRKFVHYKVAMHGQAAAVFMVCQIKELLKELRIKDTDKEVKARIIVWYQSKQSDFLFSQTRQVKLIGGGKPCKALQIEFFKPCGKRDLNTL